MFGNKYRKGLNYELNVSDSAKKPRNTLKQGNSQEGPCKTVYSFKNLTLA